LGYTGTGLSASPSLRAWLPENHLVYFVSDVVDNLKLSALDACMATNSAAAPTIRG